MYNFTDLSPVAVSADTRARLLHAALHNAFAWRQAFEEERNANEKETDAIEDHSWNECVRSFGERADAELSFAIRYAFRTGLYVLNPEPMAWTFVSALGDEIVHIATISFRDSGATLAIAPLTVIADAILTLRNSHLSRDELEALRQQQQASFNDNSSTSLAADLAPSIVEAMATLRVRSDDQLNSLTNG